MKIIDINKLQNKLGEFLSYLYFQGITLEEMSDKLTYSSFYKYFEENRIEELMDTGNDSLFRMLFHATNIKYADQVNAELLWCGYIYIKIMCQYRIPLPQILILCPVEVMVSHFAIYHEMNETNMSAYFYEHYYSNSIFKALRKDKNLSLKQIELLSGIKNRTLVSYDNNQILFNATFANICALTESLGVDLIFFKKTSSFVVLTKAFLENRKVIKAIEDYVVAYYKLKDDVYITTDYLSKEEIDKLTKQYSAVIVLGYAPIVYQKKKIDIIDDKTYNILMKKADNSLMDE